MRWLTPLVLGIVACGAMLVALVLYAWRSRPASRHYRGIGTRGERVAGSTGLVVEAIDPLTGTGRVSVSGDDWSATSHVPVAAGTVVHVDRVDGIVLHVSPQPDAAGPHRP